jgi:uncharacterized protein
MRIVYSLFAILVGLLSLTAAITAGTETPIADAAMNRDLETVRSLIKQAADVNAAQGDGMTALHWAALNGDRAMAEMLLSAGANVRSATRLGAYTPLFMAAKTGQADIVEALLKSGADPKSVASNGVTVLMMAASSGDTRSVSILLDRGADPNAKETERGQTALSFAAFFDRPDTINVLVAHGADVNLASKFVPPPAAPKRGAPTGAAVQNPAAGTAPAGVPAKPAAADAKPAPARPVDADEVTKGNGAPRGLLTPLMYAARQGSLEAARVLIAHGARLDAVNGDKSTALVLAIINGHFDLAKMLAERGADVNLASIDGAIPLYVVANTQWARKSFQAQPSPRYDKTTYIELMNTLLDHGADPNARISKDLWYSEYNRTLESSTAAGATAFWKCAEVGDVDGMRLLVSRGADPNVTNNDGVTPLLIAAGAGVHGNDDVTAPSGRLAAVKYLIEELHSDVNAADRSTRGGQAAIQVAPPQPDVQQPLGARKGLGGFTALHNAAARGDNAMILYLVSRGANPAAVTAAGITVADMANGPRERIQPYPETVALLQMLGSRSNHRCVSC